jgi:hypothetical protein
MITLLITFLFGVITGILLYRNNINKLQKTEEKGRELIDKLKGPK